MYNYSFFPYQLQLHETNGSCTMVDIEYLDQLRVNYFILNVQINETICNDRFLIFFFHPSLEKKNVIALQLIFTCVHVDN